MDQTQFMIWRFRNAEGILDYIKKWDLNTCTLNNNKTEIVIFYNSSDETIKIKPNDPYSLPITCNFSEFKETLTKLGFYKERTVNRHTMSYTNTEKQL